MKTYSITAWKDASFESNLSSVAQSVQKLFKFYWDMSKQKLSWERSQEMFCFFTRQVCKMLWSRHLGPKQDMVGQVVQKYNFWDQAAVCSLKSLEIMSK